MLQTDSLKFSYPKGHTFSFPNISCKAEETLLILGNSGTGKTTFLNLIALLLRPSSGELRINNTETANLSEKQITEFRAQNIGIVFQKPYFVNALNVSENLLLANYLGNKALNKSKAAELAKDLGFEYLLSKKVQELSGGEQQRVCIARALMNTPKVILADEPTSALDDENCEKVADLLEKQSKLIGAALIIVTHDHRLKSRFTNQITL
ncbi:ABC transporter ATP-binding protein [Lacihabitans soyangensis]|uniref:ATP-binding cassette domain-containing protein n=1 Tax=Lacihabitans soyangensis TaxID=869394 RepID=A0AAE3H165_9BACT|nr:ATP-binding cassette domain-containing protein [Lacihabitans soyangensis]MCP9762747.1 ATP-binding cassette domain-containing protein [Lacihabitans soyangensis]